MEQTRLTTGARRIVALDALQGMIDALAADGYQVLGPTLRDGAIVYDHVTRLTDLPSGWTDEQDAGRYRLVPRGDDALFGFAVGPQSWKRFLHPPEESLWTMLRREGVLSVEPPAHAVPKYAFLGVRACELHAIAIQDRVFCDGPYEDAAYAARRREAFIIAVNCGQAGGTCFCVSMQTGPRAETGFDLSLTELLDGGEHCFLVEAGSEAGIRLLDQVAHDAPSAEQQQAADAAIAHATAHMGRRLETDGIKELLQGQPEHPRWDEVASRCLSCGNCTMVCPTCFCTTVEDHSSLDGETAERVRRWDSCFTLDFADIHGVSVRQSARSRYRQWMTHKLAHWIDQFGTSGCVGCGRCISWCPVGIDITAEAAAIRADPGQRYE